MLAGSPDALLVDRAWLRSEDVQAFVSVGAMVHGWSLIVPRTHVLNLSDCYRSARFWDFVAEAHQVVSQTYGDATIFEHGCQDENSVTSCSTVHAHLHVVPLPFDLIRAAKAFAPGLGWKPCEAADVKDLVGDREYLFVSNTFCGYGTGGWIALLDRGESQFFRRVIASKLDRPHEFDYRRFPQHVVADASVAALKTAATP